jgi:hypothetical protein
MRQKVPINGACRTFTIDTEEKCDFAVLCFWNYWLWSVTVLSLKYTDQIFLKISLLTILNIDWLYCTFYLIERELMCLWICRIIISEPQFLEGAFITKCVLDETAAWFYHANSRGIGGSLRTVQLMLDYSCSGYRWTNSFVLQYVFKTFECPAILRIELDVFISTIDSWD